MNIFKLFVFGACFIAFQLSSQTYRITNLYLTLNGTPRPSNGLIIVNDSMLIVETYGTDTTVQKYKIKENKDGVVVLTNGNSYVFVLSSNRAEKKAGVYYIEWAIGKLSDPKRKSLYFRGELQK